MRVNCHVSRWVCFGGLLGFLLPLGWLLAYAEVVNENRDLASTAEAAVVLAVLYTVFGPTLFTVAVGACCGFACAYLPAGVKGWQRRVLVAGLIHAVVLVLVLALDSFDLRIPAWLFPGVPGPL